MNYINTETGEDDLTEMQVRTKPEFDNFSFGPDDFPPAPYAERLDTQKPGFDPLTQDVTRAPSAFSNGAWRQVWSVVDVAPEVAASRLAAAKTAAVLSIDADADAIYGAVQGNRIEEYRTAESQALEFAGAGYAGDAPASVSSWATAKGWTAQQACDDILATATAWRGAQSAIRSARLARKEQVRAATTSAEIAAAQAAWAAFRSAVRSQLGLPATP